MTGPAHSGLGLRSRLPLCQTAGPRARQPWRLLFRVLSLCPRLVWPWPVTARWPTASLLDSSVHRGHPGTRSKCRLGFRGPGARGGPLTGSREGPLPPARRAHACFTWRLLSRVPHPRHTSDALRHVARDFAHSPPVWLWVHRVDPPGARVPAVTSVLRDRGQARPWASGQPGLDRGLRAASGALEGIGRSGGSHVVISEPPGLGTGWSGGRQERWPRVIWGQEGVGGRWRRTRRSWAFAGLGCDGLSDSCHLSRSVTRGHDLTLSSCGRWHHTFPTGTRSVPSRPG